MSPFTTIQTQIRDTVLRAVSISESIERLRHWATGRVRHASASGKATKGGQKLSLG